MTDHDLITRIDERTHTLIGEIEVINKKLDRDFVTQREFGPVREVVYGLVTLVLVSVVIGVLALVLKEPSPISAESANEIAHAGIKH